MADGYGVPIATNLYPTGTAYRPNLEPIVGMGNLPDAYWAGRQQRDQQNQQNLLQNLEQFRDPRTRQLDFGKMGEALLQTGGAPAPQSFLPLWKYGQPPPQMAGVDGSVGPNVGYGQPQTGQQMPPSTSRTQGAYSAQQPPQGNTEADAAVAAGRTP